MTTGPIESPERFDAETNRGLIASEHRGRYLWAAQLAHGRSVLDAGCGTGHGLSILHDAGASLSVGVDISPEAVAQASRANTSEQTEVIQGDLRELPFSDHQFDLVVCFEVIEHVEDREMILDELARVVAPGGILCISTPNRRTYPPGNPYHIHEYTPEELAEELRRRFSHVALYQQSAWLGSAILSDKESAAHGVEEAVTLHTIKIEPQTPGQETFTVGLAALGEIPLVEPLLALGEPFEVRWWDAQVSAANAQRDLEREARTEYSRTLLSLEAELADALNRIAQLQIEQTEFKEWGEALTHRYEHQTEARRQDLENRLRRAEGTIGDITGALSWRITRPLRNVKGLLNKR